MLTWPGFDPVAIRLGPLAVHWYGLMYVAGFTAAWYLVRRQLVEAGLWGEAITPNAYEGLFTALILGVILGGRLGYVLFYNPGYYAAHPLEILFVWQGGMSFHGGLIGTLAAGWFYCQKHALPFWSLADRFCVVTPLGLAFGRIGNFINGELWGRPTDVPWGMVFPHVDAQPRHPSQLYEMALEGLLLFTLLWLTRHRPMPEGARVGWFLIGYAAARIVCEQFREPDPQLGFLFGPVTMGMLLSLVMLAAGIVGLWWSHAREAGK